MIQKVSLGMEVSVVVPNELGALSKITSFLVNHGINVEAVAGYIKDSNEEAELMLVTDNNYEAIDALTEHGFTKTKERDVVIVELENRPGGLKNITEQLAQNNIDILYIYCTTCSNGCPAKVVLLTSNNEKAASVLHT